MSDIKKLALKLATDGPFKTLPTPRKVSLLFAGVYLIRTTSAVHVWEHPYYPQLYLPFSELRATSQKGEFKLEEGEEIRGEKVLAKLWKVKVGKREVEVAAFEEGLAGKAAELGGLVKVEFDSMDQWFEEDTPIHVHPKDPFKRIDILPSTRPITVSLAGHVIAKTTTSMHLYETGLPVRFYLPMTSVDVAVLRKSETRTRCPYKGEAEYWDVEVDGVVHEDVFWFYTNPTLESSKVEGLLCPYNERVDIELDGQKLERPKTHFGKPKETKKPSIV